MHIIADRIKESSITVGAGAFTLAGALTGYRSFQSVMAIGDTCHYVIERLNSDGSSSGEWEVGLGTLTAANILTRTTVLSSSTGGGTVAFAAGTKHVWLDHPAAAIVAKSATGEVGILASPSTDTALTVGTPSSAGNSLTGTKANLTAKATTTAFLGGFQSTLGTAAAAFALAVATHFNAAATTVGAGSTLTEVRGFHADDAMATGALSKGFSSNINAGTNKYGLYLNGTAPNVLFGSLGIATFPSNNSTALQLRFPTTVNQTTVNVVYSDATVPATSTAAAYVFRSSATTAAAAFTLPSLFHFGALGAAVGAGSTITAVRGFFASNSIAVGVNNYGFYSDINNAANTWQMYLAGTAQSQISGVVGIAASPSPTGVALNIGLPTTVNAGSVSYVNIAGTIPATTTTNANGIVWAPSIAAGAAFSNAHGFYASGVTLGTGAVTLVYGFRAAAAIAVGSTNNYGFYSDLAANASINWSFYSAGTAPLYAGARLFIGSAAGYSTAYRIRTMSGGGGTQILAGISQYMIAAHFDNFQADCTSDANVFYANVGSAAATYTTTNVYGVNLSAFTKGAGHTITNNFGVAVRNAYISVGVNNYAYWTDVAAAANTWAFYSGGGAQSSFGGPIGILNNDALGGGAYLRIAATNPSSGTATYGIRSEWTVPATSTANVAGMYSAITTAAAAFTVGDFSHFRVNATTTGAGSNIASLYGFTVRSTFVPAAFTTAYAFHTALADAANVYQFYAGGTAQSYFGGPVGIGATVTANSVMLRIGSGSFTHPGVANATNYCGFIDVTAPPSTTAHFIGIQSTLKTAAAAFTAGGVTHFYAVQSSIGSGSAITNSKGFWASNGIAVGVNNYGFYSDIAAAAGTWQLYMSGSAVSYFAAPIQLLTPISNDRDVVIRVGNGSTHPGTGTSLYGINLSLVAPATATGSLYGFRSSVGTTAAAFVLGTLVHFYAVTSSLGAGSSITSVMGFYAANAIAVGGSNTGYFCDIVAAANNYQLNMNGTAQNKLKGGVILDTTAAPAVGANQVGLGATTAATVGAAGAAAALPATPLGYLNVNIAGVAAKIPYYNA